MVRPAVPEDVSQIHALIEALISNAWSTEDILVAIRSQYHQVDVAVQGDEIVGFSHYTMVAGVGELINIGVVQSHQRQGLGRALLNAMFETMKARECEQCFLEVRASNTAAIAIYREAGFQDVGLRKGYYAGEDALLMQCGQALCERIVPTKSWKP